MIFFFSGNKTGSELRDAWNKLYGGHVRPDSRGPTYPPEPQIRPDSLNVHKNFPDHRGVMQGRHDPHGAPHIRPDPHGVPLNRLEDPMNNHPSKPSNYSSNFHVSTV